MPLLGSVPSSRSRSMNSLHHRQTHCDQSKNSRENQVCIVSGVLLVIAREMREN
jgi:hypothetical protein